jgi:superfamily II DNA/RNA helicase
MGVPQQPVKYHFLHTSASQVVMFFSATLSIKVNQISPVVLNPCGMVVRKGQNVHISQHTINMVFVTL